MANRKSTEKLRVAILFGGRSGEHNVSLASAASVIQALDEQKYDILPVYIDQQGKWFAPATPHDARLRNYGAAVEPFQLLSQQVDVVFPVLHGTHGEDGTMQGLFEIVNVPYVGAGVVASAVGMDKGIFKHLLRAHKFPVLPWELVTASQLTNGLDQVLAHIESRLSFPIFTKPANLGSSVGITRCTSRNELVAGIELARRFDHRIIVEQGIQPRELEIAVMGNEQPLASIVGEIRPKQPFYSYEAKYVSGDSELLIPAPLDEKLARQAQTLAIDVYRAIDGAGMARVDLFLSPEDGRLYVSEINTIPGFTEISMFPKLWAATGISYSELLDRLIALGLERHHEMETLSHSYET